MTIINIRMSIITDNRPGLGGDRTNDVRFISLTPYVITTETGGGGCIEEVIDFVNCLAQAAFVVPT